MKPLPKNVTAYKKTPEFTKHFMPTGLLNYHQTKSGVWGKSVILEAESQYTILDPEKETLLLPVDQYGVVERTMLHYINAIQCHAFLR